MNKTKKEMLNEISELQGRIDKALKLAKLSQLYDFLDDKSFFIDEMVTVLAPEHYEDIVENSLFWDFGRVPDGYNG